MNRRAFLKFGAVAGTGLLIGSVGTTGCAVQGAKALSKKSVSHNPMDVVRIGFVGIGGFGSHHFKNNFLNIEGVEIRAVCDIVEERVRLAQQWTVDAGQAKPVGYTRGEWDFQRMCENEDLDLVFTATPWRWHVPVCVAAMKNGKHAATEVPAAVTIEECWELVETSEKTGMYCVMMENCCYDRFEMMVLNMVRKRALGELIHAECGYLHDLRPVKFGFEGVEALWRMAHSIKRNGDLYPTHGLGPVAQCMNINRGNQFDYLVSVGGKTRGLNLMAEKMYGAESPQARQKYALSDVVTTTIKTVNGETIVVVHDTNSPRPYSRGFYIQGTKGIARKYPEEKIYIEGRTQGDEWESAEDYYKEFEHPLWSDEEIRRIGTGHGGMDYLEDLRLIQSLQKGRYPDMDVYDAAAWSVVSELSERSIARGSKPMKFPDFTQGRWKINEPVFVKWPSDRVNGGAKVSHL